MGYICQECDRSAVARRLCRRHYQAWWKGTPKEERPVASNLKFKTIEERFWGKVDILGPDECWPWKASKARGYGEFFVSPERGKVMAQTFVVELITGVPCPPGQEGCHKCDNPPCCNPAHVYYGTRKQNVADMLVRNRGPRGEQRHNSKFTEKQIISIRNRFADGEALRPLAKEFNTDTGYLSRIVNRKVWRHIGGNTR